MCLPRPGSVHQSLLSCGKVSAVDVACEGHGFGLLVGLDAQRLNLGFDAQFLAGFEAMATIDHLAPEEQDGLGLTVALNALFEGVELVGVHCREQLDARIEGVRRDGLCRRGWFLLGGRRRGAKSV